jgi:2-methylcitrate dehydratase PrpD
MNIADFTSEALKDPVVLSLARKVIPVPDSSYNWTSKLPDGKVEVVMRDGRRIERLGSMVPGSAERPMTWEELCQKFSDCARAAAVPLSADNVARTHKLTKELESCSDVTVLLRLVS